MFQSEIPYLEDADVHCQSSNVLRFKVSSKEEAQELFTNFNSSYHFIHCSIENIRSDIFLVIPYYVWKSFGATGEEKLTGDYSGNVLRSSLDAAKKYMKIGSRKILFKIIILQPLFYSKV